MKAFRCIPMTTETAQRFRCSGRDDFGNALRRVVADPHKGFPCRHRQRLAESDETMLLGSYALPRPRGIYRTPSPIFLHADACPRLAPDDTLAPTVAATPLVSVRACDAEHACLDDLGHV